MIKKYVLYVDMYDDHADIEDIDQFSKSEILAMIEKLLSEVKESWIYV